MTTVLEPTAEATRPAARRRSAPRGRERPLTRRLMEAQAPRPAVAHPLLAIEAVLAAGSLAHLLRAPWWWFPVGGALAALVGALMVRQRSGRRSALAFVAVGSAMAGVLVAIGAVHGPASPWVIGLLGACAIVLGPVYGATRHREDKREAAQLQKIETERAEVKRHAWEAVFEDAGCKDVRVEEELTDDVWTAGERRFPAGFALALVLGDQAPEAKAMPGFVPNIEKIAANRLKMTIRAGSIQIRPRRYAHQVEIVIPTRDVMKETIAMPRETEPRSVNDPIYWCVSVDGVRLGWDSMEDPHGMFTGRTNLGKTTGLNAHAIDLTRCEDNVTMMICGAKPVRSFAPWLHPFLRGTRHPQSETGFVEPVLDWVAGDIEEACRILLDVYRAISIRQRSAAESADEKWVPSVEHPRITVLIDESPDLLNNEQYRVKPHDWKGRTEQEDDEAGQKTGLTFSELLLKIVRLGRSEGISIIFLTQRGTSTMTGADAGDIKSQLSYRAGWGQAGAIEMNATFNTQTAGVDLATLEPGEVYVEMAGYYQPILAKAYYPTREDITHAAINHTLYSHPLDDATADGLEFYAERWTRPSQQAFLRQILPNAVRTVPRQAELDLAAVERGSVATLERGDVDDDDDQAGAETETEAIAAAARLQDLEGDQQTSALEALFMAPALEPDGPGPDSPREGEEPAGPRLVIDPKLPTYTREILQTLANSDLLHGEWVPSTDILALAMDVLEWPRPPEGFRRLTKALLEVNVVKPTRPKRDGNRLPMGYWAAEIKQALEQVSWMEED